MMPGSNSIREIKTRLSVDGETAFRKSIKSVDSSLKAMKSELKLVRSGFDDTTDSMYKNEREAEVLRKMQEQLKVKVDALAGATDEAAKAYEDARKEAEKLSEEYGENSEKAKIAWQQVETLGGKMDRMATQSNNAQKYLNDVKEQLKHVGEKAGDAKEGIEDADEAADGAGKGGFTVLKGAAANLVSDGLSVLYDSLKDIVTELGNADSAYNNFAIKTGASAKDMDKYSDAIMALYKNNYGDSLSDVSDSMATVKQLAGDIPTDKLQEVTEYAIALDDVFGYDVAESMRTVNSLADQFGVSYSEAYNLIVQGAQKGLDQNGDMLDTFNEYSVQFKNLGYSAEDMFNMLSNGVQSGTWSVDKLGDAVKEFNIRVTDGTADEALTALGFDLENIKTKFAEGGATAQNAQQDIIAALMGVESEQERYTLGQQLMGTMWEDLGETTVNALFNTQGEISATKNAMQEVIDLKYDDIGTRIEAVGRKAKLEVVEPLIEKYMPKVENGLEFVSENLDEIIETAEILGKVVVTAFAAKKVYDFGTATGKAVKSFISTVKNLTTATRGQAAANTALNATNPWGWVTLAVAGVGALTYAIIDNYESYDDMVEKAAALTEEEKKLIESTQGAVDTYKGWKGELDKSIQSKDTEFGYYEELRDKLDDIVDSQGNIKTGHEKEAEWITSKLSEVTGIEIEIIDGKIQKYNELSKSIEDALKMKQAEAYLGAAQSGYQEAMTQVDPNNKEGAYASYNERKSLFERTEKQLEKEMDIVRQAESEKAEALKIEDEYKSAAAYATAKNKYDDAMAKVDGLYRKLYLGTDDELSLEEQLKESEKAYYESLAIIENYNNLDKAVFSGDVTDAQNYSIKMKYGFKTAESASIEMLEDQRKRYDKQLDQFEKDIKNKVPGITDENVRQMKMLINATDTEIAHAKAKYEESSKESILGIVQGMKKEAPSVRVAANKLINETTHYMSDYGGGGGYNAGRYMTTSFGNGVTRGTEDAESAAGAVADAASEALYSAAVYSYDAGLNSGNNYIAGLKAAVDGLSLDINGHSVWSPLAQFALPHFATGTDNFKGGFAVINEGKNGELVNLPDGSQVIPHDISLRYAEEAASRASVVNNNFGGININISSADLGSSKKIELTATQLSDALVSKIAEKIEAQKKRYSSAIGR